MDGVGVRTKEKGKEKKDETNLYNRGCYWQLEKQSIVVLYNKIPLGLAEHRSSLDLLRLLAQYLIFFPKNHPDVLHPLPTEKSTPANTPIKADFHNENWQLQLESALMVCMLISGSWLKGNWDQYLTHCRMNAAFILSQLCSPTLSLTIFPILLLTSVLSFTVFPSMTCPCDRVGTSTLIHG